MAYDDDVHEECVDGIVATIQGLALDGLPNGRVYKRGWLTTVNVDLPCIVVSLFPGPESKGGLGPKQTVNAGDWGYPVQVTILFPKPNTDEYPSDMMNWRRRIRQTFEYKRPLTLAALVSQPMGWCRWEPGAVFNKEMLEKEGWLASGFIIRPITREDMTS